MSGFPPVISSGHWAVVQMVKASPQMPPVTPPNSVSLRTGLFPGETASIRSSSKSRRKGLQRTQVLGPGLFDGFQQFLSLFKDAQHSTHG